MPDTPPIVPPDWYAALRDGATLVTANARLARDLRREFDARSVAAGAALWESPDVLPWPSWLERCWSACVHAAPGPEPVLLSPGQEQVLWERIIEESPQGEGLLHIPATAAAAMDAHRLAEAWDLPRRDEDFAGFDDAAAFLGWARRFERDCAAGGLLSPARLPREVAHRIEGGRMAPPPRLLYAGFDELAPSQRRVFDALRAAGCAVEAAAPPAVSGAAQLTPLRDAAAEIRAAARWARAHIERCPSARIGVVVPDLTATRALVERVFDEALEPSLDLSRRARARAFHISAGPALVELPLTAAALAVLGLGRPKLPIAEVGLLLRSPFLASSETERAPRALLDSELRRRGLAEVGLGTLARLAGAIAQDGIPRPYHCPQFARRMRAWRRAASRLPSRLSAAQWSRLFSRLARLAGWPGDRTPDSAEYQAIERWNELLSEFAALDLVAPPMDYSAALSRLRRMAAQARFAPADEGAPIQVMGLLEAAGARFDGLWVTGLEDRVWPAPPRPNPFLPPPLQRARGVPHSSAGRELEYARRLTARLLASAPEVVFSYPLHEGDTDLRPSPLIARLPEAALPPDGPPLARVLRQAGAALEECEDAFGPPLAPGAVQRGGMGVFEKQSACPFRAFAEFRLAARALDEPCLGLSLQDRGKVVHSALETVWRELGAHAALCALPGEARAALIARAVATAIELQVRGRGAEATPRIQALERQRVERLLDAWLNVECGRAPFEVVASERGRRVEVGGVAVDIQVDRLDRLPDGRQVIIDYKTGKASPSHWEGERPDAPQLPLYAATLGEPIAAVLFAQLAPGELRFKGLAEGAVAPDALQYAHSAPGKAAGGDLASHIAEWDRVLQQLGREFASGAASVAPKQPETCRYCDLPALCRVAELARPVEDGGAGEPARE